LSALRTAPPARTSSRPRRRLYPRLVSNLPAGIGWVEFDPTNGIVGNRDLIRVAVARRPEQAIPLSGTCWGDRDDELAMEVEVNVKTESRRMRTRSSYQPAAKSSALATEPKCLKEIEVPIQLMSFDGIEGHPMKIRAGYDIAFSVPQRTPMVLMLSVHPSRTKDVLTNQRMLAEPNFPLRSTRSATSVRAFQLSRA
jgi:hypothetical protein